METRPTQISVSFSAAEIDLLRALADYSGLSLSAYIRMNTILRAREQYQRAADMTVADHVIEETRAPV